MEILFFHRWVGVHTGGTETHIKELALRLAERGHQVDILTRQGNELKNFSPKIKIWRVSKSWRESDHSYEDPRLYYYSLLFIIKSFFKLLYLRIFRKIAHDVISVHFVTEAIVTRFYRLFFGIPYVFVLEGYTYAEGKYAMKANDQIAISMHEVNECFKDHGYKPKYVPKGLDSSRFNMAIDGSHVRMKYCNMQEKFILTVGRIESRKDYPTLIAAAKIVCQKRPDIKFIIVGDGIDFQKINRMTEFNQLDKNIIMVGAIDFNNHLLPQYYRAADLFVLPSIYEGFGYVLCEALASGIPIISTTVGAIPEVVGDAGILIPPKQPDLLVEKILTVLEDDKLKKVMITKGLDRVKKYNWDYLITEYEKVYLSCLSLRVKS